MPKKERNRPIGECPCPVRDCTETATVFRFRERGGYARFAGKLYADCPKHGRFGADGKASAQDYILESANIWGSEKPPAAPAPVEEQRPAPRAPTPPAAAPEKPVKIPAPPATKPATPAPNPTPPAPRRSGLLIED